MHTPDGFLTSWVCVLTLMISMAAIVYAARSIKSSLTKQLVIKMSLAAALIFAFQMLNFPIAGGTSGHFIGAGLAAILFGWEAAVIIMSVVLGIQALAYGDGGILALGANILSMGVVAAIVTRAIYNITKRLNKSLSVIISSTIGVVAAAIATSLLLWISGTYALTPTLSSMIPPHIVIGLAEAAITLSVVYLAMRSESANHLRFALGAFMLGAIVLALGLPFVSSSPDGLEYVAINLGFFESASPAFTYSLMPDYTLLGSESYLMVLLAGIIGMLMSIGATFGAAEIISKT